MLALELASVPGTGSLRRGKNKQGSNGGIYVLYLQALFKACLSLAKSDQVFLSSSPVKAERNTSILQVGKGDIDKDHMAMNLGYKFRSPKAYSIFFHSHYAIHPSPFPTQDRKKKLKNLHITVHAPGYFFIL